ncbi:DNA-directed RNA polymerase III subunit RPC4-like [Mya arenaria]|uniref:DNA-directed RNA polymerase III subunit RPC4-like n=1 Tax=Mya arenaria TaxID=6604 RepID=UPI0022E4EF59|nr:DNA-directed RNA polymerase III subunit RPC4-like [Mya arenaria]XP_052818041.1 DNA-directed RNA polymerase III subunit RPC4-like [Mya arenaria]XP_052818048.1 DNA-directed RNA polymerase III subunit RPC4-like [Mya arenaria]XP_052818055.1 DNA-directed RNA polymerase III subunit RPC4-like [Mya arenaria]
MASGDKNPQLPRGLIGRTGTPSGKGARLPSIRGPRDLTLGGVQKKVFTPTIPVRRAKQEPSASADQPGSSSNSDNKEKKGHHPRDWGGRGGPGGRGGRGRGRGRNNANVIQTHSLFEQGPTEKLHKPTGGSEYSYSGGGGGGHGGTSSSPRKSFKQEKTDEETKEVLDQLLRDDFISGPGLDEEDITLMPVKLPLEVKAERSLKSGPEPAVKEEPMDEGEDKADVASDLMSGKANIFRHSPTLSSTCGELFTNQGKSDEGQLLYIQLPDSLPGLPLSTEEDFQKKKTDQEADKQDKHLSDKMKGCNLDNFNEGLIGKLIVRKSGRVQLKLGNTCLDVNMGTPCGFLQDVASVRVEGNKGDISILGHVDHRLVCTPDFETMLDVS